MKQLSFRNGKFTILQMTDLQDTPGVKRETLRLMEAALDQLKPDLVVLTGDQIQGYSRKLRGADKEEQARGLIAELCAPMQQRGVPFTFTFGNHDIEHVCAQAQLGYYQEHSCCLAYDTPDVEGCANHHLVVNDSQGKPALNLYMLDSHGSTSLVGYQPLHENQVAWYKRLRDNSPGVPALAFMHIPIAAIYGLTKTSKRRGMHGHPGFAQFKKKKTYYTLDESKAVGRYCERPCISSGDAGLFAAAQEQGDMLGMFFGHDHKNSFHGKVDGIDLGYCPGTGFSAYGDGVYRGVRLFEFDENDVRNYRTQVLYYKDLCGRKHVDFKQWLRDLEPSSVSEGVRQGLIVLAGLGIAAAAITGLMVWLR
ncbi:MAG: metallophosphoesterase family protein [Oscillospiraceae bacterium]|nr:metallophosphoesterase family protein [Oscillospiraceae bacterium]